MAKRTTISIPDELHERMEKWRDYINFSKEFRDHVSKLIDQRELLLTKTKGGKKMANTIARLKAEKMDSFGDYRRIGSDHGFEWAEDAAYEEFQAILRWDPDMDQLPESESRGELREYFESIIREDENMDYEDWHYGRTNKLNNDYILGWKEGVAAFWNQVKDHL